MSAETKAMEEALQAAVARMNKSSDGGAGMPTDPIGLLMSVLPKLLENNDEREDLVEKLEGLEKEGVAPLQEQIRGLRKQVHRVFKMQEELMDELRDLREQQTAVGSAVLHLAEQMARVEIVDELPEDAEGDYEELLEVGGYRDPSTMLMTSAGRPSSAANPLPKKKRPRPRRRE